MSTLPSDMDQGRASGILPWLVEMGADELLHDEAVDRFDAIAEAAPPPAAAAVARPSLSAPQPRSFANKPAVNWQAVAAGADGVAAAEALAQSITTREAYCEAIESFDAHPLKLTASRACALSGATEARVLVISDKPRNDEDRSGQVLSGNNQVLTDRMLAAIGLQGFAPKPGAEAVAFASFIPWRPPGNRAPTELEARMCVPLILKLIDIMSPRLILCLGHLTGQWLANGEKAIFPARGKWLEVSGIPLLTTFHPETLLKSPASKRLAWHDLQSFRDRLENLT